MTQDEMIIKNQQDLIVRQYRGGVRGHQETIDLLIERGLSKIDARNRLAALQCLKDDDGQSDAEMREDYFAQQHNEKMEQDWRDQF